MGRVALLAGEKGVELVLGGCDRHRELNANGPQAWRADRYEQRLDRFMSSIQVGGTSLNEPGPGKGF